MKGGRLESKRGKRITYIGWVGHANMGDEALYQSNREIFSAYQLVPDNRMQHSRITLFGGGTVLPGWTMTVLPNRYNYAYGVGVLGQSFYGTFHPFVIRQLRRFNFRFLGVRGNISGRQLEECGIKSEVIGDPCLLLEPTRYDKKEDTRIGVNVGTSLERIWGGDERGFLREVTDLCKKLVAEGYDPVLIPFWVKDIPLLSEISSAVGIRVFEDWMNTQKLLDEIASCHVLIGEKLHSLVFSAATYTPFISLEYRPKCLDFAEAMGFEEYNVRTDKATGKRLFTMFSNLLDEWDEMRKNLIKNVGVYRKRLSRSAAHIKKDIESLPEDKWCRRYSSLPRWFLYKYGGMVRKRIS